MNLLLLKENQISDSGIVSLEDNRAIHISKVLRAKPGDRIKVGLYGGNCGMATVCDISGKSVRLKIASFDEPPPDKNNFTPIIALPRPQSFKKCIHFIASSGIRKAYFTMSERVEKSYFTSDVLKEENLEKEVILGLEQGMDTIAPEIVIVKSFREMLSITDTIRAQKLIAHPVDAAECSYGLREPFAVAIGPEGGFIAREVASFMDHSFECVHIGRHILRVEFALSYLAGRLL